MVGVVDAIVLVKRREARRRTLIWIRGIDRAVVVVVEGGTGSIDGRSGVRMMGWRMRRTLILAMIGGGEGIIVVPGGDGAASRTRIVDMSMVMVNHHVTSGA